MRDIFMFCDDNYDCKCDDICCQECDKKDTCEMKCKPIRFKEKIYSDEDYFMEKLNELVEMYDNWLLAVAVEKIEELKEINSELLTKAENLLREIFAELTCDDDSDLSEAIFELEDVVHRVKAKGADE